MAGSKARAPSIPAKVKVAIRALFEQPKIDLEAAAKAAGMDTYRLRTQLNKPHVRSYMWNAKRALLDEVCAGNPLALKEIRDGSENAMARVAAIRTSEIMRTEIEETVRGGPARNTVPGLVVIFESPSGQTVRTIAPPSMPLIEAKPMPAFNPELEPADRRANTVK
jgi:hypothetical protein